MPYKTISFSAVKQTQKGTRILNGSDGQTYLIGANVTGMPSPAIGSMYNVSFHEVPGQDQQGNPRVSNFVSKLSPTSSTMAAPGGSGTPLPRSSSSGAAPSQPDKERQMARMTAANCSSDLAVAYLQFVHEQSKLTDGRVSLHSVMEDVEARRRAWFEDIFGAIMGQAPVPKPAAPKPTPVKPMEEESPFPDEEIPF